MRTISIVGAGRLGGALALALDRSGHTIEFLFYRGAPPPSSLTQVFERLPKILTLGEVSSIDSDVVFITTQDSAIASAVVGLRPLVHSSSTIFTTSGALSSTTLQPLRDLGCGTGSIHPLISVSDPVAGAKRFESAYFCIEGDPGAIKVADTIVKALHGRSFSVPTDKKPLYHAAAVTSSGHLVSLIDMAITMLEKCGIARHEAQEILRPLIESTLENLNDQGIEGALTGTFARGDVETFEKHLNLLKENASADELEIFLDLGYRSTEIAGCRKRDAGALDDLRERVLMAKRGLR